MRLARWRDPGGEASEWLGVQRDDGSLVPCHRVADPAEGDRAIVAIAMSRESPAALAEAVPAETVRLLAPIRRPGAIRDFYAFEAHVRTARASRGAEMDPDWYELPVFYFSNPHTLLGPDDAVRRPRTAELDYELEVAAVVGVELRDATEEQAAAAIAGYTVFNDFSARDVQRRELRQGLGPAKGKDFASAFGPVLATPDELGGTAERPAATMRAWVNGVLRSQGELADLHHPFPRLLAQASQDALVRPGDLVGSGTVGTGCLLELRASQPDDPPPWLAPGDVVELEVDGIGRLRNTIV